MNSTVVKVNFEFDPVALLVVGFVVAFLLYLIKADDSKGGDE